MTQAIALHRVLGRKVYGRDGRKVGRLEAIPASREGSRLVVSEFHIGTAALLERFAAHFSPFPIAAARGFVVRWDQMDWRDPIRPRLTCDVSELKRFTRVSSPRGGRRGS
jgi:hypothetical protein